MANYYDWNPRDDKPKDQQPAVDPNSQPEPVPIPPPEPASPVESVESLQDAADTNQWSSEEFISTPPLPLDDQTDDTVSDPIDTEDELHPMYRVVSAMLETADAEPAVDEQAELPPVDGESVVPEAAVVETVEAIEGAPPTKLKNDELLDAEFPPIPTRVKELTQAIERYPQSPVNYVLRGEAHWDEGHGLEALRDFQAALKLAESRDTTWEFVNRSILDRARQGLRRCGYQNT